MKYLTITITALSLLIMAENSQAQDLDPRAYARFPVNLTLLVAGFSYSDGGVLIDPTLPIKDLHATVESTTIAVGHTFSLLHQTAQATIVMPFGWAQADAMINGQSQNATRSGFSDLRLRISMLLFGAPALTLAEFAKAQRRTTIGASLTIIAPTGEYFPDKLINLGTSRWSFKPELAISQPFGNRWLIDLYAGIWFFTTNDSFYPGTSVRSQDPMGSFQAHLSYNIKPTMWVALDMTFYTGGMSTVDEVDMHDRQSNSRIGATMVFPLGRLNSVKMALSTGAIIRYGADFTTLSVGWQRTFLGKQGKIVPKSN